MRLKREWLEWLKRRWLLIAIIIASIVLVILNRNDLRQFAQALLRGEWQWVGVAAAAQTVYYLLYAVQYHLAFATVGVASRVHELIPVMFASIFLRTLVPSGGASGAAVFIDDAARRKQSPARAAEGALLVLTLDLSTMLPLILYTLVYLAMRGVLRAYEVVGSVIFLLFVIGLTAALFLGRLLPEPLQRLLDLLRRALNDAVRALGRPDLLPPDWPASVVGEFGRAAKDISARRDLLLRTSGVALAAQLVNLVTVTFVGLAYGQAYGLSTAIAAFSIEAVFSVVTIVPNGLIVAEAVMIEVLISLGVPLDQAVVITLVYRGLSVWLPLLAGFLFLRQVPSLGGRKRGE